MLSVLGNGGGSCSHFSNIKHDEYRQKRDTESLESTEFHEFYINFARDKIDSMVVLYELNKNLANRGYIPQTRIEKDDSNICELTEEDLKKIQENLKSENPLEL